MKSSLLKVVLPVVLAVALAFTAGSVEWKDKAQTLPIVISEQVSRANSDTFFTDVRSDISSIRTLAYTCILVAECTPAQGRNAVVLSRLEDRRVDAFEAYLKIRNEAITKLEAGDLEGVAALKEPYYDAKKQLFELTSAAYDATANVNLPSKLRPDFEALN